jgi:hypothetical protein
MANDKDRSGYLDLAGLSDDDLLAHIGNELPPAGLGAGRPSRADLIRRARLWQEEELPKIAQGLCSNPRLISFRSGEVKDSHALFVLVVDLLSGAHFGIPIAGVAMLITRMGLNTLCGPLEPKQ